MKYTKKQYIEAGKQLWVMSGANQLLVLAAFMLSLMTHDPVMQSLILSLI